MGIENCRTWNKRRVTYTREVIILASTDEKNKYGTMNFDAIPMFQIEGIREMNKKTEIASKSSRMKENDIDSQSSETFKNNGSESGFEGKDRPFGQNTMIKFSNSIEINTSKDGVNSGRSYYVKVSDMNTLTIHS